METAKETSAAPRTVRVRYNHQEIELPLEEAIRHIQKGMNYDKLAQRLAALQNGAPAEGADEAEGPDAKEAEAAGETEEAREDGVAVLTADLSLLKEQEKEFRTAYPEVKDGEIPDAVLLEWGGGVPLKYAYQAYENRTLKERVKELEQKLYAAELNGKNAVSSMGSAFSSGATQGPELTAENIKKMSSAQRRLRMGEILAAVREGRVKV